MKQILYKKLLPIFLRKRCIGSIPRSGAKAKKVNCIAMYFKMKEDHTYFLLEEIKQNSFSGLKIINNEIDSETHLELHEILTYPLDFRRFKGLLEFQYKNIYQAFTGELLGITCIRVSLYRLLNKIKEKAYNKRNIEAETKIGILRDFIELESNKNINKDGISLTYYLHYKHGSFFFSHPHKEELTRKYQLYFNSLVESLDLKKSSIKYKVLGKAINTIDNYNETERRHRENIRTQKGILCITILLLIVGLIQSGIIQLPVLLDFTEVEFLSRK